MSRSSAPFSLTSRCRPTVPPAPAALNTSMVLESLASCIALAAARALVVAAAGRVGHEDAQSGDGSGCRRGATRRGRVLLGADAAGGEGETRDQDGRGEGERGPETHWRLLCPLWAVLGRGGGPCGHGPVGVSPSVVRTACCVTVRSANSI